MTVQIQFTLTVNAGKWVIARAIAEREDIKEAYNNGTILLMGGTTVSAISELLTGLPIRISGRINTRGTKTAAKKVQGAHTLLIHKGKSYDYELYPDPKEIIKRMGEGDFIITGANAYDSQGYAALMAGSYGMSTRIDLLAPMHTEGAKVLIAIGLEKQIPGTVNEAVKLSGRNKSTWSMGMPVGLVPVVGDIINEIEAIEIYSGVRPYVIGRGGIDGAEGSSTMIAKGSTESIEKIIKLIDWANKKEVSGVIESFESECYRGCESCVRHKACCYKSGKLFSGI